MNLSTEKKQAHGHKEQTCGCQGGSGMDWKLGVGRSKLLHLEWISNEVLLYSMRNYIQSFGIEHEEDSMRKRMYIFD